MNISGNMTFDVEYIKSKFGEDPTLLIRTLGVKGKSLCTVLAFDGMIDGLNAAQSVILPTEKAISEGRFSPEYIEKTAIGNAETRREQSVEKILERLMYGDTLMLFNGTEYALTFGTKGWQRRGTQEPEGERVVRGPREGFVESQLVNLGMLRRRLKTTELAVEGMKFGKYSNTGAFICYLKNRVDQNVLAELHRRLEKVEIEGVIDSNYIIEHIRDAPGSPFKTVGITERPDIVAAKLLEGRVAVIVDGSPCVITLPYLMIEMFQSNEDYYANYIYGSINRLIRIVGFVLTVVLPGAYLAVITHHQEVLPQSLLLSITASRQGVPFPTVVEMLLMMLAFEILREASLRMPNNIGQALSIVGAIVLGQAAVEAQLVSAPLVIIVALTGTTTLMIPKSAGATIVCRLWILFCGSILGLPGVLIGGLAVLIHLCRLESFGIAYFTDGEYGNNDIFIRKRWGKLRYRDLFRRQK